MECSLRRGCTCKKLTLSFDLLEEMLQASKLIQKPLSKLILSNLLLLRHYLISSNPSAHDSSILLEMFKDLHTAVSNSKEPDISRIAQEQQEKVAKYPPKPRPNQFEEVTLIIPYHRMQADTKEETKNYISTILKQVGEATQTQVCHVQVHKYVRTHNFLIALAKVFNNVVLFKRTLKKMIL